MVKKLTLKGISQKGRNRIKELGNLWLAILCRDAVSFSPDRLPGGWLLIAPISNTEKIRWIRRNGDADFEITESQDVE